MRCTLTFFAACHPSVLGLPPKAYDVLGHTLSNTPLL